MRRADGTHSDLTSGHGMTMEEIAREMGVTKGGVWVILRSAYRKLRRNPRAIAHLRACAKLAQQQRDARRTWLDDLRDDA